MSLAKSMKKVVNFTNKIVGVSNPNASGANVSAGSWGKVMGLGNLSFKSLADVKQSITDIKAAMAQTLTTAACLKYMLWDNPSEMLGFLNQLGTGVMGAVSSVADEIFSAISYQINAAVNQVAGTILSLVSSLQSLIGSVINLFDCICDTAKSWSNWCDLKIELELQLENCKDMFAAIAACFLNKYLGPLLDEFTEKAVGKINSIGNELNNKIYEGLQDANMLSSYAKQEAFLLNKASIQIQGLSKESILG